MASRGAHIIRTLYGDEVAAREQRLPVKTRRGRATALAPPGESAWDVPGRRYVFWRVSAISSIIVGSVGLVLLGFGVHYFNLLTALEQDVFKGQARIDSLLQRRRNISANLARTVQDYAVHERSVFDSVSKVRASLRPTPQPTASLNPSPPSEATGVGGDPVGGAQPPDRSVEPLGGLLSLLASDPTPGLLAVAERYPDLKLSGNFQRFMDALVETEAALSDERMSFSETVNAYTTQLKTLPGKWFARLYSFEDKAYFAADETAKIFRPVDY